MLKPLYIDIYETIRDEKSSYGLALEARKRWSHLSLRQMEVASLLASGLSNKEIAEELGISPKTLDIHRGDVYERLGVQNQAGVAMIWLATLKGKRGMG